MRSAEGGYGGLPVRCSGAGVLRLDGWMKSAAGPGSVAAVPVAVAVTVPVPVVVRWGGGGDGDHASGWHPPAGLHRQHRSGVLAAGLPLYPDHQAELLQLAADRAERLTRQRASAD